MPELNNAIAATAPLRNAEKSRRKPAASNTLSRTIAMHANNAACLRAIAGLYARSFVPVKPAKAPWFRGRRKRTEPFR